MQEFNCLDPSSSVIGHHFLEASAGTGKTFAIEHVVLRLIVEEGIPLERILAVTFTRAATRDLKRRISQTLKKALQGEVGVVQGHSKDRIKQALATIDTMQVYTIHGFCYSMLKQFALESGLPLDANSPDEGVNASYLNAVLFDFLRTQVQPPLIHPLQFSFLLKKYRDMQTVVKKLAQTTSPLMDLPSGFTFDSLREALKQNQISLQCIEDIEKLAPYYKDLTRRNGTLKEEFACQLASFKNGIEPEEILSWKACILSFFTEKQKKQKPAPFESEHIRAAQKQFLPLYHRATNPSYIFATIAKAAQQYVTQRLLDEEQLTPDLLLKKMEDALLAPKFCSSIRSLFDAVIVDEFQDTDPLQWGIFSTLFYSDSYQIPTLYLVGDPKQSIYGFRSADVSTYLNAKRVLGESSHKKLSTNYRSQGGIINALNLLFSHPKVGCWMQVPSQELTLPYDPVKIGRADAIGAQTPLVFVEGSGLNFIPEEVQRLSAQQVSLSSCAILVRDRFQGEEIRSLLQKAGFLAVMRQQQLLSDTPVYTLLTLFQKACIDLFDVSVFLQLFLHPLVGGTLEQIENEGVLSEIQRGMEHIHSQSIESGLRAAFIHFCETTWFDRTPQEKMVEGFNVDLLSAYKHVLVLLGKGYSVKQIEQDEIQVSTLTTEQAIQIMTIHTSKGLEFEYVFAIGVSKGYKLKDHLLQMGSRVVIADPSSPECKTALQEIDAEQLRLLYVALTRAKERLYIPLLEEKSEGSPLEVFFKGHQEEVVGTLVESGFACIERSGNNLEQPRSFEQPNESRILLAEQSDWSQGLSFSSLTTHSTKTTHYVAENELPQGAEIGTILHSLLEVCIEDGLYAPFSLAEIEDKVTRAIENSPYAPYKETLLYMLQACFTSPLPHLDLSLASIPPERMLCETDFLYKEDGAIYKGIIDLLFFHGGKWYIVDWKTTALPSYDTPAMEQAMRDHEYSLQAEMYGKAVKKQGLELGGVYYIFVRGLHNRAGIYHHGIC